MELKCPECNGEVREWNEELRCWSCGHILEYTEANRKHADAKEGRILAHGKSKSNEKSNIKNKQSVMTEKQADKIISQLGSIQWKLNGVVILLAFLGYVAGKFM